MVHVVVNGKSLKNKHKFVQKVAKKNILLISFEFSTKQGQTR